MRKIKEQSDTVGNKGMKKLFEAYETMSTPEFRLHCQDLVKESRSSKSKKLTYNRELGMMNSKDRMVQFMTNFVLSGEGMSV